MADFRIGARRKASDLPPQLLHSVKRDRNRRRERQRNCERWRCGYHF